MGFLNQLKQHWPGVRARRAMYDRIGRLETRIVELQIQSGRNLQAIDSRLADRDRDGLAESVRDIAARVTELSERTSDIAFLTGRAIRTELAEPRRALGALETKLGALQTGGERLEGRLDTAVESARRAAELLAKALDDWLADADTANLDRFNAVHERMVEATRISQGHFIRIEAALNGVDQTLQHGAEATRATATALEEATVGRHEAVLAAVSASGEDVSRAIGTWLQGLDRRLRADAALSDETNRNIRERLEAIAGGQETINAALQAAEGLDKENAAQLSAMAAMVKAEIDAIEAAARLREKEMADRLNTLRTQIAARIEAAHAAVHASEATVIRKLETAASA